MLFGRVVFGLAFMQTFGIHTEGQYTWGMFISGAFVNAIPGIILHIVLIPVIVIALQKARFITDAEKGAI
jgi:hypothetical protein